MRNLVEDLKALKLNLGQIFLSTIWWLDAFQRREKIILERLLNRGMKKLGLKFNPGLALSSLRTAEPSEIYCVRNALYELLNFLENFSDSIKNNLYSEFWWIDIITSPGYLDTRKMSVLKKKKWKVILLYNLLWYLMLYNPLLYLIFWRKWYYRNSNWKRKNCRPISRS